jgi:hypothetical protein
MIEFKDLKNASENVFTDISSEEYRSYDFGEKFVRIERPIALSVSKSGGHRILDADEKSHYIPSGWIHLIWRAKPCKPHFVR